MGSKGAHSMGSDAERTMYVAVAEHDPIEVSECGRFLRSRHEPECVVDLVTSGKWVRLAATPHDAARKRRRLVRIEDIGDLARTNKGSDSEDVDQPQHTDQPQPIQRTKHCRRAFAACILFVVSAAGAAVTIGHLARGDDLMRTVESIQTIATVAAKSWLWSNVSWTVEG